MGCGMMHLLKKILFAVFLLLFAYEAIAQPGSTVELKKPPKYEKRTLGSEKTGQKKFTVPRHLYQNMVTHYNYYFNAENKLNAIVDKAKGIFKDDYTNLLPFYNYSLDYTASDGSEIDSIIYKCTAGVLLHDLRNDWIDNLYLLLGKAYYFRKNFDSAAAAFQYINYAFAPKDEGYDIPIGSNVSNTDGVFSIATVEKRGFLKKISSRPPSRNNALTWMARNYIEAGQPIQAKGILEILRSDPNYPERLQTDLQETLSYWYYTQKQYDSAAPHLEKALKNASNRFEQARWEFLIAQMYQLSGNNEQAVKYYSLSAAHTTDPVMEVYANLNSIGISSGNKEDVLKEKLNNLLKMAKKDRYQSYRDIIYYAAAQVEIERGDTRSAEQLLQKSIKYSINNPQQKNQSFLLLADVNYKERQFVPAHNFYDSIDINNITKKDDLDRIALRKPALKIISDNLDNIHLQDSLQQIAALPEAEREAFLKKTAKKLRKMRGLSEESDESSNPAVQLKTGGEDLFSAPSKGDWYFNNNALKSSGYGTFRQQWGNRPDVDNWRRKSEVDKISQAAKPAGEGAISKPGSTLISPTITNPTENQLESSLPLTEELLQKSNDSIAGSLFTNGLVFQNQLENYGAAIETYENLNHRFPSNVHEEESLFNLYFCYHQTGNDLKADSCLTVLNKNFSKGKWTELLNKKPEKQTGPDAATKAYEHVYNLFVEGKFEEAKAEKIKADQSYGKSAWTPQLLFIEAIYYVSAKEDSVAINRLNDLTALYPENPLAARAKTMVDVLKRRKEIESYLTNLQITRNEEEASQVVDLNPSTSVVRQPEIKRDSTASKPVVKTAPIKVDTATEAPVKVKSFTFDANQPQYVLVILDKVAPVFANEAKNAFTRFNSQTYYNQKMNIRSETLDDRYNLLLIGPFAGASEASDYVDKTKPVTQTRILPWLTADKYNYIIISQANLDLLNENKDLEGYRSLLQKALPGKF